MEALYLADPLPGGTGIAHTRWATHGVPSEAQRAPARRRRHRPGAQRHHRELRRTARIAAGARPRVHLGHRYRGHGFPDRRTRAAGQEPARSRAGRPCATSKVPTRSPWSAPRSRTSVVGARRGCPLLVGVGIGEHFLGSDAQALIQVTNRMIYLDEDDVVEITRDGVRVFTLDGNEVERSAHDSELSADAVERGEYRHYMQKEIFEQPRAVNETLEGRIGPHGVLPNIFGVDGDALLPKVRQIHIIACGTSYHAGLVAKYWIEDLARIPVSVEVASEYRYREAVVPADTPVHRHLAVRRNRRHAGGAARIAAPRLPRYARHLQRRRIVPGARVRPQADDPRRPRNRRRLDQGLHHPARRPGPAGAGTRPPEGPGPGHLSRPAAPNCSRCRARSSRH